MSALEEHHLTDQDTQRITVAIGFHNARIQSRRHNIGGRILVPTSMQLTFFDFGVELIRQSATERYWRSNLEKTLIDCLGRPRMVASAEILMMAWARAFGEERVDKNQLLDFALKTNTSTARRVGLMFSLLGFGELAREAFPTRVRRPDRVVPLLADGPDITAGDEIDSYWRVTFNIPRSTIEGWLSYGK
jgi:predicted transcriptional regulator of viral defense system